MSVQGFEVVRGRLAASNYDWPRDPFSKADQQAEFLERRLARAVGDREIVFATATVEGVEGRRNRAVTSLRCSRRTRSSAGNCLLLNTLPIRRPAMCGSFHGRPFEV